MNIIFVVYEWCFAMLAAMLNRKMKNTGSLLLCAGLTVMAILTTIEYAAGIFSLESVLFSKIMLALIMITPLLTLMGFFIIVINLEKYTKEK